MELETIARRAFFLGLVVALMTAALAGAPPSAEARADGERKLWYRIASVKFEWNHRTAYTSPASGESGSATSKVAWNARTLRGDAPLIRRSSGGRLGFSGAEIEGKLTDVTHTYSNTWKPPQDPVPCTPEKVDRSETLIGTPRITDGVILGFGFKWEGFGVQGAKTLYTDNTGPVTCDDCPRDHPFRGKAPIAPGPGPECTFEPDDTQEFENPLIAEQYHSEELETHMLTDTETQTRLSGAFGDEKIRFRNAIEGEAPKFVGPDGTERTESADKTVTFKLRICGRAGLRSC